MSEYLIQDITLSAIADAIRAKTGTAEQLTPEQMISAIANIQAGGGGDDSNYKEFVERTTANPTLPSDLTKIVDYAFYEFHSLALTSLPAGVTSIGTDAFYNCKNLALASLPAGVTNIGISAFANCSNLALASIPAGVTSINDSTFFHCTSLALTSLPAGITSIGNRAFYYCYKLALTSLPAGLQIIKDYAFAVCSGLTSITFEGTPRSIGSCFGNCSNLTTINVPWAEGAVSGAPWGAKNATINYNYTGE